MPQLQPRLPGSGSRLEESVRCLMLASGCQQGRGAALVVSTTFASRVSRGHPTSLQTSPMAPPGYLASH